MPTRIQLSRKKGFRLPPNAKSVARPTKWGNPFLAWKNREWYGEQYEAGMHRMVAVKCHDRFTAHHIAAGGYRDAIAAGWFAVPAMDEIRELRGYDLACWCPLDMPCHADVLLELANS